MYMLGIDRVWARYGSGHASAQLAWSKVHVCATLRILFFMVFEN